MGKVKIMLTVCLGVLLTCKIYSQDCDNQYIDSTKKHLTEDHFTFLKSFKLLNHHGEHQKFEYTYMLVSNKKYEFYFEGYKEGDQDVKATLYDPDHKIVATSVHNGEYEHRLVFECKKKGIYYVEFTFKDNNEFCGVASLGFSR